MAVCAYCKSEKTPTYCFGDGEPICHECHASLPNTIAACRHEIVELRKNAAPEGWRLVPNDTTRAMRDSARIAMANGCALYEIWEAFLIAAPEYKPEESK